MLRWHRRRYGLEGERAIGGLEWWEVSSLRGHERRVESNVIVIHYLDASS